jgi:exonuclease SbcC
MVLSRLFSKPRWQSKDAAVRRDAVARDDEPALRAELPRLARDDVDAGVRLAALKRVADPALAQALAHDDRDEGVRHAASALFTDLLSGAHANAPALTERVRLLRGQDDMRLIEHIAARAPEAELRLAALARVTRTALLVERVTGDSDAGVRAAALARIDDEAQLERIAERARKTDKVTSREAGERLVRLRLARGDATTVRDHARTLCESLEASLRRGDDTDIEAIDTAWNAIAAQVEPAWRTRYAAARGLVDLSRDPQRVADLRERARERERIATEIADIEQELAAATAHERREALETRFNLLAERFAEGAAHDVQGPQIVDARRVHAIAQRLHALALMPAPVAAASEPMSANVDREAAQRREQDLAARRQHERDAEAAVHAAMAAALDVIEPAIARGDTAAIHAAWPAVAEQRKRAGTSMPPALRARHDEANAAVERLTEWQRWGDNQRRRQLCEELEALPATGLHPDAIATRVREAQTEWTRLDALEGRVASAVDGLARRFRAACHAAIAPTRPYFEKRDALRKAHGAQTQALVERARAVDEAASSRDLLGVRRDVAEGLRALDRVDPRERKALAQSLKDALSTLDQRVEALEKAVADAKSGLIEKAEALISEGDVRAAMSTARDLQKRWQASGNGRRARDEAQWRAFRKAVDAVFARADGERVQHQVREREAHEAAIGLCNELDALATAEAPPARGEIARIDAAWQALGVGDPALRRRHEAAHAALREASDRRRRAERRGRFDTWLKHYGVVRDAERGAHGVRATQDGLAALPPLTVAAEAMRRRVELLAQETIANDANEHAHRDALIELERFAGVDSPAGDRQRRLDLQVGMLSARLRGERAAGPAEQLEALLVRCTEAAVSPADSADFDARLARALGQALDQLD